MNRFANWLRDRDVVIHEAVSAETLHQHDFDALAYAQHTLQQKKNEREAAEMKKDLQTVIAKLEHWADPTSHGVAKLKFLATIFSGAEEQAAYDKYYDFKNLHDLQAVFSQDNLEQVMTNSKLVKGLAEVLQQDFDTQIWPHITAKHGHDATNLPSKGLHSGGDLGKHYGDFVVSHILHTAEKLLAELQKPVEEPKQEEKPAPEHPEVKAEIPKEPEKETAVMPPLGTMASPSTK